MRPTLLRLPIALLVALALGACGKSGGRDPNAVLPATGPPSTVNYSGRVLNFEVGVAATPETPTFGGAQSTWSIAPPLPSGLNISASSGTISGTPTVYAPRTLHTVRATNSQGSAERKIIVQVGGRSRFVFGANETGQSFRVFGSGTDGNSLYHHSWTEDLLSNPLLGTDDSLRRTSISQSGDVICGVTDFDLICWKVDLVTGELTAAPVINLTQAEDLHDVSVHPSGKFVYVASRTIKLVRAYSINPTDGSLALVASFPTGTMVNLIRVDPLGRYVLVRHVYQLASNYTQVRSYRVNADGSNITDGSLFTIPASNARGMEIGALGEAVYFPLTSTATNPQKVVLTCTVNPDTAKLTLVGFLVAGANPTILRAAPNGKHLYVTDPDQSDLDVLNIHPTTRKLSASLQNIPVSSTLSDFCFSSDGSEVYLTDAERSEVLVRGVNASSGALEGTTGLHTRPGLLPLMQAPGAASPVLRATELYALNASGAHLKPFEVDGTDGNLNDTLTPTLVPMGSPLDLAVRPQGDFLFTASQAPNGLDGFAIQSNGELTDLFSPLDLGASVPVAMALDPTGRFLYLACNGSTELRTYSVASNGQLTFLDADSLTDSPTALTVSPGGEFVYVAIGGDGSLTSGQIEVFRNAAASGLPSPVSTVAAPGYPNAMAINRAGTRAYVSLRESTGVKLYTIGVDGSLTAGTETNAQPLPNDVRLSHDGRFAYVTFENPVPNSDGLLLYEVDPSTGVLHGGAIGGPDTWADAAFAGDNCRQSLVSHDGRQVYVLAPGSGEIWCFDASATNGQTTFKSIRQPGSDPVRMALRFVGE